MSYANSHMDSKQRMIKTLLMLTMDCLEISHKKYKSMSYQSKAKENVVKKFTGKDALEWIVKKYTSKAVL